MKIERPYQSGACEKCIHYSAPASVCSCYYLGMSPVYCPYVSSCEKFQESKTHT